MGVLINHSITFLTSPLAVSLALMALGLALVRTRRRLGMSLAVAGLGWLCLMSTELMYRILGLSLERAFPPACVEDLPQADAIVVLGGGVGGNTNTLRYAELYAGADRVAHAARIWKAGKAPVIIPSGSGEEQASRPLLLEWGVPASAIAVENDARNTEENARFVEAFVTARHQKAPATTNPTSNLNLKPQPSSQPQPSSRPRVLLVTSAWHMRRSLLLFRKYAPGVEVVPAACDYEATVDSDAFNLGKAILPDAETLMRNSAMLKEHIGYWGYRLLR